MIDISLKEPVILFADPADHRGDPDISAILLSENIRVIRTQEPVSMLSCGDMLIIRDTDITSPCLKLLERVRAVSDIPVMMLCDKGDEMYTVMALRKGADQVMSADSFAAYEFKARIVAMLRRLQGSSAARNTSELLSNGSITIDRRTRQVYKNGKAVRLTVIEYGIVKYLAENCGNVCSISDIYSNVWKEEAYDVKKILVEHIRRIRCKLEEDPHNPRYIKVVSGMGYKMEIA